MIEYTSFGHELSEDERLERPHGLVAAVLAACEANRAFKFIERRRWESDERVRYDVLVIECVNDQVPTRNEAGVLPRERLAVVLPPDLSSQPQVRALRRGFPSVMHLNHVPRDQPVSLCLYFEPWAAAKRTWTPERFLQRILLWLTETSKGTLHRHDQPVEAMYLEARAQIVLPPNWRACESDPESILVLLSVPRDDRGCTLRAHVTTRATANQYGLAPTVAIPVAVGAIVHGGVESFPATLGQLSDGLEARGSSVLEPLRAAIASLVGCVGAPQVSNQTCVLLVSVPTKRSALGAVERVDVRGFWLPCELWKLGVDVGALCEIPSRGKHYPAQIIGGGIASVLAEGSWRDIAAVPIAVRNSVTRAFARKASAVSDAGAEDARILAGVGALGSALADVWSREGWGQWSIIDPDFVQPHNVVRHLTRDCDIGHDKVTSVKRIIDSTYPEDALHPSAFRGDILSLTETEFTNAMTRAQLVVDATTTLEVPRELSRRNGVARCVSVFLTPSGNASAMLLEDRRRCVRLDDLEAQYYCEIISGEWGEFHLSGSHPELWVGAGCRDVSLVMSNELVQLHASILARQVRLRSALDEARILVWITDSDTCEVRAVEIPVHAPVRQVRNEWTIVSNQGVSSKLKQLRAAGLPAETGGVIVGYIDHPLRTIFVVDVLAAPADSERTETGFIRGVEGLATSLKRIRDRTAGIVGYVGEWHSHPPFNTPTPSPDDVALLAYCASALALDGDPAVMMIVGADGQISYSLGVRPKT